MTRDDYFSLIEAIDEHNRHYYDECAPQISDQAFDQLVKTLEHIEKTHPEWIVSYSPTQRVNPMKPLSGFKRVTHQIPMLSLANTYSKQEVSEFIARVHKLLGNRKVTYSLELKMDGTAVSLYYEKGLFTRGATRGNGKVGDDITDNLRTIRSLPMKLKREETLEIRGEVFMPLKVFEILGKEAGWANPRNAAAGSLKLLDPEEVSKRHLEIICYAIAGEGGVKRQSEVHDYLKKLGLPTSSYTATADNVEEIFAFADQIEAMRGRLPFEIDGVVIKVDDLSLHDELGSTGKCPRFATAYKFAPMQAITYIEGITVQVGRTGVLTPVAELTPVFVAGSTISRATLHNEEEVERKDIRIGDTVVIEKGGDVIPKVVSVVLEKRPKDSQPWKMPTLCPSCGSPLIKKEGEVAVKCPNKKCGSQHAERLIFFASKGAMDIEGLGEKVMLKLIDHHLVNTWSDIYRLKKEDLEKLEGFKEKSVENLLKGIEVSKEVSLARFIFALGIPFVGIQTAEELAHRATSVETLLSMTYEEFLEIEGVGEKVASSLVSFFKDPEHQQEIMKLMNLGVAPQQRQIAIHHSFLGKSFVLTGTLHSMSRDEAGNLIKTRGGKVSSSVSKNTDYVLVGADPGSKYDKAQELGIQILDEAAFKNML
ncbi:MAG: NAD-dependent DNA ligase LigA [Simkaniaceae bacterium]|nr:NAD-dependent DNA ligase LigA [Simkaniaceae bacterium]